MLRACKPMDEPINTCLLIPMTTLNALILHTSNKAKRFKTRQGLDNEHVASDDEL